MIANDQMTKKFTAIGNGLAFNTESHYQNRNYEEKTTF